MQEALSNAIRHSAASRVNVDIRERDASVVVVVHDDGAGFEADGETSGFGLAGMRERVSFADGQLEIETAPEARNHRSSDAAGGRRDRVRPDPRSRRRLNRRDRDG